MFTHYVTLFKKQNLLPTLEILPFFLKNSFFSICLITPKSKIFIVDTKSILVSLSYLIYNLVGLI